MILVVKPNLLAMAMHGLGFDVLVLILSFNNLDLIVNGKAVIVQYRVPNYLHRNI